MSVVVSGAAVRDDPPVADDFGVVVRGVGVFPIIEPYLQRRFDITDPVIYVGYAALGVTDADAAWTIKRIQFTAGNPTTLQWSSTTAVWNDRAATTYT